MFSKILKYLLLLILSVVLVYLVVMFIGNLNIEINNITNTTYDT